MTGRVRTPDLGVEYSELPLSAHWVRYKEVGEVSVDMVRLVAVPIPGANTWPRPDGTRA
jgi:hypothetical protein